MQVQSQSIAYQSLGGNCQIIPFFLSGIEREGERRLEEAINRREKDTVSCQFPSNI